MTDKILFMIKFYYNPSPNPAKVALFLEESGLPYEVVPIDTRKGEQFAPSFVAINPNSKTPAITDGDVRVFDSNAILLYLAEKTGRFLPDNTPKARGEMLSWLMFIASGIGSYLLGATYTIVDIAAWGWCRAVPFILSDDARRHMFRHLAGA